MLTAENLKQKFINKETKSALIFSLVVYIFMWFHFDSHQQVTNIHYQKNQVQVIAKQVRIRFARFAPQIMNFCFSAFCDYKS